MDSMKMYRLICALLTVSMCSLSLYVPAVQAGMVPTDQLVAPRKATEARERLQDLLQRDQVVRELKAAGVDPAAARERISAMTDQEVEALSGKIDQLPAGGDIVGALVLIFLVLLVTDILGYTDVFPFVKKHAR
jgi:hypothetical protein